MLVAAAASDDVDEELVDHENFDRFTLFFARKSSVGEGISVLRYRERGVRRAVVREWKCCRSKREAWRPVGVVSTGFHFRERGHTRVVIRMTH